MPEWSQMKGSSQPGSFPSLAGLSGFSELSSARPGRREILPWGEVLSWSVKASRLSRLSTVMHGSRRHGETIVYQK